MDSASFQSPLMAACTAERASWFIVGWFNFFRFEYWVFIILCQVERGRIVRYNCVYVGSF